MWGPQHVYVLTTEIMFGFETVKKYILILPDRGYQQKCSNKILGTNSLLRFGVCLKPTPCTIHLDMSSQNQVNDQLASQPVTHLFSNVYLWHAQCRVFLSGAEVKAQIYKRK